MAKVALRSYCRDIEVLIEHNQIDEAIAHCRHILKTYPKHLETYRLMGKAYLESQRYGDAADIFQRVLMAIPDDFVCHVGMSIIRDDEGNLDSSIWHMERAFESQPSNAAIQSELRRLYGRRDGMEPPKIRLTRGALAQMYAKGELYPQAISEARAVLAEDPNRADLLTLLARIYFSAGKKVEATEVCSTLLKRYPYCFDANRVMVEILPGTGRAESTQVYRNRVSMMDPYSAYVSGSVFTSSEVADQAVMVEQLEYIPEEKGQPGWASSLGVKIEEESQEAAKPVWLPESEEPQAPVESVQEAGEGEEDIPEWLKAAGWKSAVDSGAASPQIFQEDSVAEEPEIEKADMPDWLQSMAPAEGLQEETSSAESLPIGEVAPSEDDLEWLEGLGAPGEPAEAEMGGIDGSTRPDWLTPGDTPEAMPEDFEGEAAFVEDQTSEEDLPDWLKDLDAEQDEKVPSGEDLPAAEMLTTELEEEASPGGMPEFEGEAVFEDQLLPTDVLPEDSRPEEPQAAVAAEDIISIAEDMPAESVEPETGDDLLEDMEIKVESTEIEAEDLPDWLRDLEPVRETEVEPSEELPDWLKTDTEESAEEVESIAPEPAGEPELEIDEMETGLVDLTQDLEQTAETPEIVGTMEVPGLEELPVEEEPEEELKEEFAFQTDEVPEMESDMLADTEPLEEFQSPTSTETAPEVEQDEAMAWLESLAARQRVPDEEMPSSIDEEIEVVAPEAVQEYFPPEDKGMELVGDLEETDEGEFSETAVAEESAQSIESLSGLGTSEMDQDAALAWLESLAAKQGAKPEELLTRPEDRLEEMPDWVDRLVKDELPSPHEAAPESPVEPPAEGIGMPFDEVQESEPIEAQLEEAEIVHPEETVLEDTQPVKAKQPDMPVEKEPMELPSEEIFYRDEIADWIRPEETPSEPAAQASSLSEWLKQLDTEEAEEESESPEATAQEAAEMPDWLQEFQPESESPPAALEDEPLEPAAPGTGLIFDEDSPVAEPVQDLEAAAEMPAVAEDLEVEEREEEPVQPVSEIMDEPLHALDAEPEPVAETVEELETPTAPPEEPPAALPLDKDSALLQQAQTNLAKGQLKEALASYDKLVKKGRKVEETIHDLSEALNRFPVDVMLWQSLGDALMRADRLQEALDAYTKAEELLR